MSRYRIVPYSTDRWKVQKKVFWGWKDHGHRICGWGECFDIVDIFDSEGQAEDYIDEAIKYEAKLKKHLAIPPREYP